jgi:chromosomal replication initiation ATPase DnaA
MRFGRELTRVERATANLVLERVAERSGVPGERILGKGAEPWRRNLAREFYAILRHQLGWSYPKIASYAGRDHQTILMSLRRRPAALRGKERVPFPLPEAASNLLMLALQAGRELS